MGDPRGHTFPRIVFGAPTATSDPLGAYLKPPGASMRPLQLTRVYALIMWGLAEADVATLQLTRVYASIIMPRQMSLRTCVSPMPGWPPYLPMPFPIHTSTHDSRSMGGSAPNSPTMKRQRRPEDSVPHQRFNDSVLRQADSMSQIFPDPRCRIVLCLVCRAIFTSSTVIY